jgi:fibronectin-binding autotransporter adhesin
MQLHPVEPLTTTVTRSSRSGLKTTTCLAFTATLFLGQFAQAGTLYWDTNGSTAGAGTSGVANGTWSTGVADWTIDSTGSSATVVYTPGSDVVFSAGTDATGTSTVTLAAAETANSVTVNTGTISLSGNSITLGAGGLNIASGTSITQGSTTLVIGASQTWTSSSVNALNAQSSGLATAAGISAPISLIINGGAYSPRGGLSDSGSGGGALSLTLEGGASWSVGGTASNTYSGGTFITNGSYRGATYQIGTGAITLGNSTGSTAAATLTFVNVSGNIANSITTLANGTSTLVAGGGGNTYNYTGPISLGNTLILSSSTSSSSYDDFTGLISGTGGLTINSSAGHLISTIYVNHANTYIGGTTLTGGTLVAQNTAAFGAAGAPLSISGGAVDLATDTTVNAYNTTLTGSATIYSDKATAASAGITQQLGTLSIGANTLTISAGANVSGGTPIVAFGATSVTGTATTTFAPGTAGLTMTTVTGSAASGKTETLALNGSATSNAISDTIADGSGGGKVAVTVGTTGAWTLGGASTYTGGTTVSTGTLLVTNGSGSAVGTGALTVARGATFGGSGIVTGVSSYNIGTTGSTGTSKVQVGSGIDTSTNLTLAGVAASKITQSNLTYNLSTTSGGSGAPTAGTGVGTTSGAGNELVVGTTALTLTNSDTLTLNLTGSTVVAPYTPFVLIAGNGGTGLGTLADSQYAGSSTNGISTFTNSLGQLQISGLTLAFTGATQPSWYSNSYLFLVDSGSGGSNVDDIEVEVVPEPSTWALIIGGLSCLVFWQRRRRNS